MVNQIHEAAGIIKNGGIVAFPTETVYGLGADAFNAEAVARIYEIKARPQFDPLIVHVCSMKELSLLCKRVDDQLSLLAEKFWPGPLTIVVPKKETVPGIVTSGLPTVAVRMPDHPLALELISRSGTPIAAPSANKFGMLSPTESGHVRKKLEGIDYIIEGGKTTIGLESTVMALSSDGFKILRPGAITGKEIEGVIPRANYDGKKNDEPASPGMLKSHYSPVKPIYIKGEGEMRLDIREAGFISFGIPEPNLPYKEIAVLSPEKDLKEAAVNLFSAMHRLEDTAVRFIIAEPLPEEGIGVAIMDRLRKAAYQYSPLNKQE